MAPATIALSSKNGGGGGNLTIKIISAELTRNTELFGKMDPFVSIDYKGLRKSTKVCKRGGKHPSWGPNGSGEIFEFQVG